MKIRASIGGTSFRSIPNIIHQTWKSNDIPIQWHSYRQSWLDMHPKWQYKFWTDKDIEHLIVEKEPDFLSTFRNFPRNIQRVDAAKLVILKHYGGVYADLDTECLQSVAALIEGGGMVLSRTSDGVIEGAFIAAPKHHTFCQQAISRMCSPTLLARFFLRIPGFQATGVLLSTGPIMLHALSRSYLKAFKGSSETEGLRILIPTYCSSKSWWKRKKAYSPGPDTFVVHHHADSWLLPLERTIVHFATPQGILSLMLLILSIVLLVSFGVE